MNAATTTVPTDIQANQSPWAHAEAFVLSERILNCNRLERALETSRFAQNSHIAVRLKVVGFRVEMRPIVQRRSRERVRDMAISAFIGS